METLSVRQPYATLIVAGVKETEYRSWPTKHRGPLLIHSTKWSVELFDKSLELSVFQEFNRCVDMKGVQIYSSDIIAVQDDRLVLLDEQYQTEFNLLKAEIALQIDEQQTLFPMQAIVGSVNVVDVQATEHGYLWQLSEPVLFANPVRDVKGKLRIWQFGRAVDTESLQMVVE